MIYYDIAIVVLGFIAGWLLFARFPVMRKGRSNKAKISVIIPARNEEQNLSFLLSDLTSCGIELHEIICVDDASTDETANVARQFGATCLHVTLSAEGWTGKSLACSVGAASATGDVLLFLDADVRITPSGMCKLLSEYARKNVTLSVQPYHETERFFEQFSIIFNAVQTAANGTCFAKEGKTAGLFGPVILISRQIYEKIGGHDGVKGSVIEDISLGRLLSAEQIPYKLYTGDRDISYKMYSSFFGLVRGFTKNFAGGAVHTRPLVFLCVFLWITSCTATPIFLTMSAVNLEIIGTCVMSVFYIMWAVHLRFVTKHIGKFKLYAVAFFPVFLAIFLLVFFLSALKKLFGIPVIWKGRKVKPES